MLRFGCFAVCIVVVIIIALAIIRSIDKGTDRTDKTSTSATQPASPPQAATSQPATPTAAQLDKCRKDVRTSIKLGMIDSYQSESGFRRVVVGPEWHLQTFETKSAFATMLGVCLYLGQPDTNEPHLVSFYDRYSGKQIGHLFHGQLQPED